MVVIMSSLLTVHLLLSRELCGFIHTLQSCFDILLTVHLNIFYLNINQLDAQNFIMSLFPLSTCARDSHL